MRSPAERTATIRSESSGLTLQIGGRKETILISLHNLRLPGCAHTRRGMAERDAMI